MKREDLKEYQAALIEDILKLRVKGRSSAEIQEELGITVDQYQKIIRKVSSEAIARNTELVDEMFLVHHRRLEDLYARVRERIEEMEHFDEKVIRLAISILERQARLLGLDKERKGSSDYRGANWLSNATQDELVKQAEEMGLRLPDKFRLPQ